MSKGNQDKQDGQDEQAKRNEELIYGVKFKDPRAAEARRLRVEEGMTSAEIRERLNVAKNKLQYWLVGLPVDGGKQYLRGNAKDDLREEARRLRWEGKSIKDLVKLLGCSQSSASLWVRDIPLQRETPASWTPEARALRDEGTRKRREAKFQSRMDQRVQAKLALEPFSERELIFAGAIAYWCEGSKWKDWQTGPPLVVFINSDPGLIRLFLRFLDAVPVPFGELRYRLHIHRSASERTAHEFWAREIGISLGDFSKTTWKQHNPKTVRKNVGDDYHGCLAVAVLQSNALYHFVDGVVGAVLGGMAPRPSLPRWSVCGHEPVEISGEWSSGAVWQATSVN